MPNEPGNNHAASPPPQHAAGGAWYAALQQRIAATPLPPAVQARVRDEWERLSMVGMGTSDALAIRGYLEWLQALPWERRANAAPPLDAAARILDERHYGAPKLKERLLELIAVQQLTQGAGMLPIVGLEGPPGVGKTALAGALAEALGRPLVRISLAGVADAAFLRGTPRTSPAAQPGRIIQALREAGVCNPVVLLDDLDLLGGPSANDPVAALLALWEAHQHGAWVDNYLELPVDLRQVLFVVTFNDWETIDEVLLERLDLLMLPSPSDQEKLVITERWLWPRLRMAHGLANTPLAVEDAAVQQIISAYTLEAGVRELEQQLAAVCRWVARRVAAGDVVDAMITPAAVRVILGPPRVERSQREAADTVGAALSMVWAAYGGDVQTVEIAVVEGKGGLLLTGSLGDVMQESAQAALSFVRANAKRLGIDPRRFDKIDLHVHLPENAVPKEGPSAGITLVCALVSALTGRAVRKDVALTGEVTLRGRVLGVGSIREKVLGAHRAGITDVVIPVRNLAELEDDLPEVVRTTITVHAISSVDDVFPIAFADNPLAHPWQPRKRTAAPRPKTTSAGDDAPVKPKRKKAAEAV